MITSFDVTLTNTEFRFEPADVNAPTATIEIRAARRPYSIAVAPVSSLKNFFKLVMDLILTPRVTAKPSVVLSVRLSRNYRDGFRMPLKNTLTKTLLSQVVVQGERSMKCEHEIECYSRLEWSKMPAEFPYI